VICFKVPKLVNLPKSVYIAECIVNTFSWQESWGYCMGFFFPKPVNLYGCLSVYVFVYECVSMSVWLHEYISMSVWLHVREYVGESVSVQQFSNITIYRNYTFFCENCVGECLWVSEWGWAYNINNYPKVNIFGACGGGGVGYYLECDLMNRFSGDTKWRTDI